MLGKGERIVTTNLVVGETWTFLRIKAGHPVALSFIDRVGRLQEEAGLTVDRVTGDQETQAWRWLRRHDERPYSFIDATSFQVMRDRRLREALAFDQDFAAAGFVELQA
jgi:predicted nucleic acid-binding protein